MDWIPIIGLFLANAGLITWFRAESRNDWRHMDAKTDAIREDIRDFQHKFYQETKDFHSRLCDIEAKRKR